MKGSIHIIHRVNLEIEVPDMRLANRVKDDVSRLLYNDLLPKLEKYMDTVELADKHIQFNRLDINLQNLSEENFEEEFASLIEQAFHRKIEQGIDSKDQNQEKEVSEYTREQKILESFLFFLETGRLPWWSEKSGEIPEEQNLSETLKKSFPEFQVRLITMLERNGFALERLLNQYSFHFILQFLSSTDNFQPEFVKNQVSGKIILLLQHFVEKKKKSGSIFSPQLQKIIKSIIMQIISNKRIFSEQQLRIKLDELSAKIASMDQIDQLELKSLFDEIHEKVNLENKESFIFSETQTVTETTTLESIKKSQKKAEEEDGFFLNNAGLVLLHPFFESFLSDFNLLDEGHFKDTESQTIAVHLLHYLATKMEFAAEYELGMEKFLCGWDLDLPITRDITLTQAMKDESETLLTAAIRHWRALKSTSPDGLREGFLQREGKLILNDFQNRLILENKAQDALLSYLPWGYSVFKLSWMENALYVEWQ